MRGFAVFEAFVVIDRRIEFGLQEGKEEVKEVDAKAVGDDVPALGSEDADEEGGQDEDGGAPAVGDVGGGSVEVFLVLLREVSGGRK